MEKKRRRRGDKVKWVPWNVGCGWTARIAPGITLVVDYSITGKNGYWARFMGMKSKSTFKSYTEAMDFAERAVRKILEDGLENLDRLKR